MVQESLPNLMNRYFPANSIASRKGTNGEESNGIGLYISKKIIEEHDGRIWYESKPGEGTVFYVELPVLQQQDAIPLRN